FLLMHRLFICQCVWVLFALCAVIAGEPSISSNVDLAVDDFRDGSTLITRYHFGRDAAKPYFWPMYAPSDIPVTRAWPMEKGAPKETKDHVHQKSAWFCHGDVIPEGIELKSKIKGVEGVDFWSEAAGHGRIAWLNTTNRTGIPRKDQIVTHNIWRTSENVAILNEERVITLKLLGDNRLLTIDIDLHASECPITFGDTKEG